MKASLTIQALILITSLVTAKTISRFAKTKGERACVHQCELCFELYGCLYDGKLCTEKCLETDGGSMDEDCEDRTFHRKCKKGKRKQHRLDQGGLYLLDKGRVSQLYLPSGKTRKKIPSVQPFLIDVQALNTSSNGLFLAGALRSGKVFVWNRDKDSLHTTPVLDKIRNVLGSNNKPVHIFISNSGMKILLLSGFDQLFLWETENDAFLTHPGEPFSGTWVQIQSGEYLLPSDQDKESAVNAIFYEDQVLGQCAMVSWIFNKDDKMHVTTIQLHWPQTNGNFGMDPVAQRTEGVSNLTHEGVSLSFTAKWHTFVHPLHTLTPAKRVVKSRKAYVACFSNDGQVLAIAMNQKVATDSRMMFYSTASSSAAIVIDLKGCGCVKNDNVPASGKLWWIADMAWTRDSLFLVAITRCGSLAILTKLGEPVLISTSECSVDMGPNYYLPLHPRISFRKPKINGESDSSISSCSDADVLRQRFSVAVHPNLPVILTSDGYLVTVMQLPGIANYKGVILSFMTSISRLVPESEVDQNIEQSTTATSRVNLFQSDSNLSRVQSVEEMSENTLSSSSSLAGYGLASGDQGMAFMPIITPDQYTSPPEHQDKAWKFAEAQNISLKALALGTSAGPYWTKDISSVLYSVVRMIVKLFSVLLRDHESLEGSLNSSLKIVSRTVRELKTVRPQPLESQTQKLNDCFTYFKTAMELFHWDSKNRNAFSLALRLILGIIKEILGCKYLSDELKISSSVQFLEFSEDLLDMVYSWKLSSKSVGSVDRFSPTKSVPRGKESEQLEPSSESDASEGFSKQRSQVASSLSAPWLYLYNYTANACKKSSKQSKKMEDEVDCSGSDEMTQLLCDIQKKLQDAGVAIPSTGPAKADHASAVASFAERNQDDTAITATGLPMVDSPGDSLFGRKRANRGIRTPKQSTPTRLRKAGSLDRLLDASSIKSPHQRRELDTPDVAVSIVSISDKTTETLLAILYVNLQQYDLRSALELVFSLMEPPLEHFDSSLSSLFAPIIDTSRPSGGQDYATSQILGVLLQTYPILRVADKCGVPVVQSLARFMAAYFSNLPLYIFPSYHPEALPPFYTNTEPSKLDSTSDESFALSQGVEALHLDREKVSAAARDQGVTDIWSANNALEFMLVSGLVGEAAWLTSNLGDWKHALLLSVAHAHISRYSLADNLPATLLPNVPEDVTPERIVLVRLHPIFQSPQTTLPNIQKIPIEIPEDATSTPIKERFVVEEPNHGKLELEIDDKLVKDVGKMLQASVVAGLDIVPVLSWKMLRDLLGLVSQMEWIVPEELYLPAPPLFCPQPPTTEKEVLLPRVYRERQLRSEIAVLVQKLLTLFHSSNCMAACIQWYVQELIVANEKWYNVPKDDQEFVLPQSLVNHSEMTSTFVAAEESLVKALKRNSPKSKGKPSPPRPSTIHSSSVSVVLACFQQFCFVMWMLHARDKMSRCARKYRRARNEAESNPQTADLIDGLCWETLQWTLKLHPFSSFLGATSQVSDTLLTLLSEMQPSITTAEITARHFPDPNLIPTTSGRAKFKRLMTQFRGITLREAGSIEEENSDEPLSVFYRMKCVDWEDEVKERQRLYGDVQREVFPRVNIDDELHSNMKSKSQTLFTTSKKLPSVGASIFETSQAYLDFLDTFCLITFTKTASEFPGQATTTSSVPLLLPYEKLFTFSENRALKEFHDKASVDKRKKIAGSSLFRSQSYSDVRSSKPGGKPYVGRTESLRGGQTDMRRSNSLNDVSKATGNSGLVVLGNEIMEMLPNLAFLGRWSSEGSSNIEKAVTRASDVLPVMKVHVELQMLVNSLWLLKDIYGPWELNENVNPEFLKQRPKPLDHPSLVVQECVIEERPLPQASQRFTAEWPSGTLLRRASSDTDLPRIMVQSPTTEDESQGRHKKRGGSRKSRAKQEKLEAVAAHHSDTESAVAKPTQGKISPKDKRSRKKSKSAKRSLNLEDQVEDIQDGGIVANTEPPQAIKHISRTPKSRKPGSKVKHVEESPLTNKTADQLTNKPRTPLRNDPRDTSSKHPANHEVDLHDPREISPSRLPNHEADLHVPRDVIPSRLPNHEAGIYQPHQEGITRSTEPDYHSSPVIKPRTVVPDMTTDSFKEQQMIDRSRDLLPGNSAPQSVTGGVELLLVLRPPNAGQLPYSATSTTHVPLLKLSTMTAEPTNVSPKDNASSARTHMKDMGSQTKPARAPTEMDEDVLLSDRTDKGKMSVDFSAQYDESRDASCQTAFSPHPSQLINQGAFEGINEPSEDQKSLSLNEGAKQPPRYAWPERNDTDSYNIPFPLLRLSKKASNANGNVPPMKMFRGYPQGHPIQDQTSFPLLHIPKQAPVSNPKTFQLFQIPPESRNLPLLRFPSSQDKSQNKPDMSKIKFLDVSRNSNPFLMLKKGETTRTTNAPQNHLLHKPEKQSRHPDFTNFPLYEAFSNETPMPLLRMPERKPERKPRLVPPEALAAFEKKRKRKEDSPRYSRMEKENIKPKRNQEEKRYKSDREHDEGVKDLRQTMSRQRRREHQRGDKQEEDHVKPKQVHVKTAQRTRPSKTKKEADEEPKPTRITLDEGLSEESDLEMTDLSEHFNLSEEEQMYFNIQSTPKVSNPQVDAYCKELEERVRKQFDKELESRMKEEMEKEVKEQVKKQMERQREEEEVRKRVREELALQERLEQQARAREMELAARLEEQPKALSLMEEMKEKKEKDHPIPRKRSVKHEKGTNVHFEDDIPNKTRQKQHSSVKVQVEDEELPRSTSSQGNQTEPIEKRSEDAELDKPKSFAPVLPPDIFMGLTFPRDQVHDDDNTDVPEVDTREVLEDKGSTNQFISVADIDGKLWEKVEDSVTSTARHEEEERHVRDDVEEIHSDVDEHTDHQEPHTSSDLSKRLDDQPKQYDSLTVTMMDSVDIPRQRMHSAQKISKERISTRLEEMTQQLEAMEQITHNMEREFKSSNVLLNAIEGIGDIMSPPAKKSSGSAKQRTAASRRHEKPLPERYQRVRDSAPWRRDRDAPVYRKEETPRSSANVAVDGDFAPDESQLDKPDDVLTNEGKVSFKDESIEDEDRVSEKDLSSENNTLEESGDRETDENIDRDTPRSSRDFEESRDMEKRDSVESEQKSTKDRLSDMASSIASRHSRSGSFKDMPKLSSETLKEIFADGRDSSRRERNNQRSLEKRKKIQDWMGKKRAERHATWKNEVEELRSVEFKPFTTATEGPSSLKKMKLAQKERETKRRKREEASTDERMKEASNLLSEMLAEPVPRANTLRNIRYTPPKPKEKAKSKHNDRYNKSKQVPLPSEVKTRSGVARPGSVHHRDPAPEIYDKRKSELSNRGLTMTPYTSSPIHPNIDFQDFEAETNQYGLGGREETRSVTPSGADFITMKTYRMHEKEKLRRSQELEREKERIYQTDGHGQYRMDLTGFYRSGSSIDIDNLMDQIPDGSTIDEDNVHDIQSLLSDDSELKELLADVVGSNAKFDRKRGILKSDSMKGDSVTRPIGMGTVTLSRGGKQETNKAGTSSSKRKPVKPRSALQDRQTTSRMTKPRGPVSAATNKPGVGRGRGHSLGNRVSNAPIPAARSGLSRDRGKDMGKQYEEKTTKDLKKLLDDVDEVSPWNTGDSLNMSDDVAQLLAEAKQAIGDDMSESSGSIMSNIDWDAVDKIMNDL